MSECFNKITFHYIPWDANQMADTLATLSSMVRLLERNQPREDSSWSRRIYPTEMSLVLGCLRSWLQLAETPSIG
ncbi:hypothetical protein CR513_35672, partial [Mucuna pruriens]